MSEIKLSKKARNINRGVYEHYKGKRYSLIGVGIHSETLEEMVIYKGRYGDRIIWLRPLEMFFEKVKIEGKLTPRFKLIKSFKK
jgi:hypothetical protein